MDSDIIWNGLATIWEVCNFALLVSMSYFSAQFQRICIYTRHACISINNKIQYNYQPMTITANEVVYRLDQLMISLHPPTHPHSRRVLSRYSYAYSYYNLCWRAAIENNENKSKAKLTWLSLSNSGAHSDGLIQWQTWSWFREKKRNITKPVSMHGHGLCIVSGGGNKTWGFLLFKGWEVGGGYPSTSRQYIE